MTAPALTASPDAPASLTPLEFIGTLYGGAVAQGFVEFRLLPSRKQVFMPWPIFEGHPDLFTLRQVPQGQQAYFGISLRRDSSGGGAGNVHPTHLLWVDFDLKGTSYTGGQTDVLHMAPEELRAAAQALYRDVLASCAALDLPPRACVYTGHGLQMYWSRRARSSIEDTDAYNRALVASFGETFGADGKTVDAARIFRLPGSRNLKNSKRPLPVEVWGLDAAAWVEREALEPLMPRSKPAPVLPPQPQRKATPSSDGQTDVIQAFNARYGIHEMLTRFGYTRDGARYTRPGEDASGRDVTLLENSKGVLCSYHHSSNDPLAGEPDAEHLLEPFDLYRLNEHRGDHKAAVKAAAAELGLSHPQSQRKRKGSGGQDGEEEDEDRKRPPAGTRVLEYAQEDGAELWHDQGGNAFITTTVNGHREHYRLPSRAARDYLQALFYDREARALNAQSQGEALGLMQAIARREGQEYRTAVRVAHQGGSTYLDLGTPTWDAVEVGHGYWKVIRPHECPVRFTRPAGFLPLPAPVEGGDLGELREFLNTDERGFLMCTAWLLAAASGLSPYPVLAPNGEQGTGKSTLSSVLRNLLDPNQADRRRAPKEERDLFIAAQASHVLSFDNLSSIPGWLSDALCVLSTGGAFTARTLYSDSEETILEAVRPVIVNGIPDLLARPDLAERALTVTLYRIPPERRTPEKVFWARYERARPRLLGALLSVLAHALRHLDETELKEAPRLADFARLIVAAEGALPWAPGEFLSAYGQMQSEAAGSVLDGEPVAEALRAFMDDTAEWTGTVKKLLGILEEREYAETRPPQGWPRTPKALGNALRRLAPALSQTGYGVTPAAKSNEGVQYRLAKETESKFTKFTTFTEVVPADKNPSELAGDEVHSPSLQVHLPPASVAPARVRGEL
ncbi:hypothetical protein V3W47_10785 [Deinococcus sp. YIM 134068]|uniref:hypothetical protein n=1 Tax=Deinococcus lichenicola TaxID=3118910 RepID=UPI002F926185